jgi:oligopeptide/dipeptide ABC transporter ATP-binding protein
MTGVAIRNLAVEYRGRSGAVRALDGVSVTAEPGEVTALVGESGSGKSTVAMAVGRLLHRSALILNGAIEIDGDTVTGLDDARLRQLRSRKIAYVFQDPVGSLDPTMKIGDQVRHVLRDAGKAPDPAAALADMRFIDVAQVLASYPHQVSGGMAQRVAIAMALARDPKVLIADEPTAALDASIGFEILDLMARTCRLRKIALVLATHDLPLVRRYADRIAVMYAGRVVEAGPAATVLDRPRHPYTQALLASSVGAEAPGERLSPIPGMPPTIGGHQTACAFADRCAFAQVNCTKVRPTDAETDGRVVCCLRAEDPELTAGANP